MRLRRAHASMVQRSKSNQQYHTPMEIRAIYCGSYVKKAGEFNGRAYDERYVLRFLTETYEPKEFTVSALPAWCDEPHGFELMLVGTLHFDIMPDRFNSKPGRAAYRDEFRDFVRPTASYLSIQEDAKIKASK